MANAAQGRDGRVMQRIPNEAELCPKGAVDEVPGWGTVNCMSRVSLVEGGQSSHLAGGEGGGVFDLLQGKPKACA